MERNYISRIELSKPIPESSYLSALPAVRHLVKQGGLTFSKPVTFFVGENGTGKSTLLEAIAVASGFNPEGGTKNFTFSTHATHSDLYKYITIVKKAFPKDGFFLRAESFYNVASNIDDMDSTAGGGRVIDSYGGISLHKQSHGESFLALVLNRFGGNGIYLLDEPEAALSPSNLMVLIVRINELVRNNSQFIIATHSPILMAFPGAQVYELSESGIRSVYYRKTQHYIITRTFLENPEKMFHNLLDGH